MIQAPGCPVCVLPSAIDRAIRLALDEASPLWCTYADPAAGAGLRGLSMLPRSGGKGADIRMVDRRRAGAGREPGGRWCFCDRLRDHHAAHCAVDPPGGGAGPRQLPVLSCCHVLTPPAIIPAILESPPGLAPGAWPSGFIGPAHVSPSSAAPYARFAEKYRKPVVIAGFEPWT